MKMRGTLILGILACSILLVIGYSSPSHSAEKTIQLRYAHFMPATDWWYADVSLPWLRRIEKATNGKVKITGYPAQTLVNQQDMYESTRKGITDMGTGGFDWTPGVFPLMEVFGLPGIPFNSSQVTIRAKWAAFKALQAKGVWKELSDVKVLRIASTPPTWLATREPIRSLEDLKGKEIRAAGKQIATLKALGAVPLALPVSELYTALDKGTIQGALVAPTLLKGLKLAQVTNSMTFTPIGSTTFFHIMNLKIWNSLPPDVQKAFEDDADFTNGEEATKQFNAQIEATKIAMATKPDWKVIKLPDSEWERWSKLIDPVAKAEIDALEAKGLPARMIWNEIQEQVRKFNQQYPSLEIPE